LYYLKNYKSIENENLNINNNLNKKTTNESIEIWNKSSQNYDETVKKLINRYKDYVDIDKDIEGNIKKFVKDNIIEDVFLVMN
jgi:hypothetical protein